jgi:hypothetical protein
MPVEHESPDSKAFAKLVLAELARGLAGHGFTVCGNYVVSDRGDVVLFIELRKGSTTRRDRLVTACYAHLHSRRLHRVALEEAGRPPEDVPLRKLQIRHADFSFNVPLGELRHWTMVSEAEASTAASEMLRRILVENLSLLEGLQTPEQMYAQVQEHLHTFRTEGGWGFHLPTYERRLRAILDADAAVAGTAP